MVVDQVAGCGFRRGGVSVLATPLSSASRRTHGKDTPVRSVEPTTGPWAETTAGIGSFPDADGRSILGRGIAERRLGTVPARNERFMAP
jgi:hypothetical protein